ncbi:MAG: hypothetical protein ACXWPM_00920 [Bdellovibrionota bacterium]
MKLFRKPTKWKKFDRLVTPKRELWWMQTHAMCPTPERLSETEYRVYFSGRDEKNRSHIGYCVLDLREPRKILEFSREPVLAPGELGCFDDNGVTPSSIVQVGDRRHLYFLGWNPGSTVRMHLFGGLAISERGGPFVRYSRAPIIERCRVNPFLNTAPFASRVGDSWKLYYVSGVGWVDKDLPRYNIQVATSKDGLEWQRDGIVCIDFKDPSENALARPWVIHEDGVYKMWFAHKGAEYRMGYAESLDGLKWERNDALAGIDVTPGSWDSTMLEYASVIVSQGRKYMFYNGDNYGRDGFGLAIEE